MPLSIEKLEKLLATKGFVPSRYFVMHGLCVYIEIVSISDAEMFLLYIPSKYKFTVKKGLDNVNKIKYLDIDETEDNTADDYAGEPDQHSVENTYREIDVGISPTFKNDNIAPYLEENYKRVITLKDISDEDSKEIRDIVRQLKRLRFCVQNVKYKIAILYKNFLCVIKRDDTIECYVIKKYSDKNYKKLYVTTDLEILYEKMDSLMINMSTIRKGLYHILDKNHFTHTRTLQTLMEGKNDIMRFSDRSYVKKLEYEKYIKEAVEMFESIKVSEKEKLAHIHELNEKYKDRGLHRGLHNDIERTHQLSNLEEELTDIQKIKEDIVKTIFNLKEKRENTMLMVDKIMFDNNVMIECVLRNFSKLEKIC